MKAHRPMTAEEFRKNQTGKLEHVVQEMNHKIEYIPPGEQTSVLFKRKRFSRFVIKEAAALFKEQGWKVRISSTDRYWHVYFANPNKTTRVNLPARVSKQSFWKRLFKRNKGNRVGGQRGELSIAEEKCS